MIFSHHLRFADTVFRCARACYNNTRAREGQGPSIDSEQRYCSKLHKLGSVHRRYISNSWHNWWKYRSHIRRNRIVFQFV